MALPFFYIDDLNANSSIITLNEETSKHVVQVLRMQAEEQLNLTDGKGHMLTVKITNAHKKNCVVSVIASSNKHQPAGKVSIAISLVKSPARFEWFLEKATELGVSEIVPIICERTERQHFRYERMKAILVSAMLQSQQVWLPVLKEPIKFETLVREESTPDESLKLIAHCEDSTKQQLSSLKIGKTSDSIILIGPEGDFTSKEIVLALEHNYLPAALGETRLRTETAGVAAAVLLCVKQI